MTYSATFHGFETAEQAKDFLKWYEGQGEQDETIGLWMDNDVTSVLVDVHKGINITENGAECTVNVYSGEE